MSSAFYYYEKVINIGVQLQNFNQNELKHQINTKVNRHCYCLADGGHATQLYHYPFSGGL